MLTGSKEQAGWQMQPRREYQGGRKAKTGRHNHAGRQSI
jgi:hypothetical protein